MDPAASLLGNDEKKAKDQIHKAMTRPGAVQGEEFLMLIAKKKQFPGSKILLNPAGGSSNNAIIKSSQHQEGPRGSVLPESTPAHSNAKQLGGVTGFQVSPSTRDKDISPKIRQQT